MRFSAGYQRQPFLKEQILRYRGAIREVYFAWPGFASGRTGDAGATADAIAALQEDLGDFSAAGLSLNWLLNGHCYGRHALSRTFFNRIGDTADRLRRAFGLTSVTTLSPVIAHFLHENFSGLEVRASVNMGIGTPQAAALLEGLFDGIYLKRECNYDLDTIHAMRETCTAHGQRLYLLANSGCLNDCPVRTFHDNLVAHEDEVAEMDNAFGFTGLCHDRLNRADFRADYLRHSNWIRPEDVSRYEGLCDGMKLATRVSRFAGMIVEAYAEGRFHGNLLDLTEPSFSGQFYPDILDNGRIPETYWEYRRQCGPLCTSCGRCREIQDAAMTTLPAGTAFLNDGTEETHSCKGDSCNAHE